MALAIALASAPSSTEITVYNQGFGLVKEERTLELAAGRQTVRVEDVASRIEPTSVSIRPKEKAGAFSVLEQNYQYDLISPTAILAKSVGKRVAFTRVVGNSKETVEGVLLSSPVAVVGGTDMGQQTTWNGLVIRTDNGQILLNPTGEITVLEIPAGLISRPTLLWDLEAPSAGKTPVELSYLTQGITWEADYVVNLRPDGKLSDVQGWVTINNQSGATYQNAKLKLLAGEVYRAPEERPAGRGGAVALEMRAMKADFQEESLFEYHLYTLQRPATIAQNEIKQLSLLEGSAVKTTKLIQANFMSQAFAMEPSLTGAETANPEVFLMIANTKENGLGMPLPKGKVKVYQGDSSGSVQMLGEDRIEHTPRNETVSLKLGRSFDVVVSRKRTNYVRLGDRGARVSVEVEVRNRKTAPETVRIVDNAFGQWKIVESTEPSQKLNASMFAFDVKVDADQVKKLTYTVEYRW